MSLSAVLGNALAGMQAQQTRLAATANNVANWDTPGYRRLDTKLTPVEPGGVQSNVEEVGEQGRPDELADMTSMVESGLSFAANAKAFETGASMWDMLLSIKRD